jgi:ubiquinone/menaquinone biosynthesis C-methylase UbiE
VTTNADKTVVREFGREWTAFDQSEVSRAELCEMFDGYFHMFPWESLPKNATGFDMGCGSGRWATLVASRVGTLHCIDASEEALHVARHNLSGHGNCVFHCASVDAAPLSDASADFGYCLGVLHHVPDTAAGLRSCAMKLKPGAPFLVYLYFAFDNKPKWYRTLWRTSETVRFLVSRAPFPLKLLAANLIALLVYWPLAKFALMIERLGGDPDSMPLAYYRHRSVYVMRTDALDRFGTRLERRFTRREILSMLEDAGFECIQFSPTRPYWCVLCYRK